MGNILQIGAGAKLKAGMDAASARNNAGRMSASIDIAAESRALEAEEALLAFRAACRQRDRRTVGQRHSARFETWNSVTATRRR